MEEAALPPIFWEALLASCTRQFEDAKAHEAVLSSWSPAWGGIRKAAHGLTSPDVTPRGIWGAGPGHPLKVGPPGADFERARF